MLERENSPTIGLFNAAIITAVLTALLLGLCYINHVTAPPDCRKLRLHSVEYIYWCVDDDKALKQHAEENLRNLRLDGHE